MQTQSLDIGLRHEKTARQIIEHINSLPLWLYEREDQKKILDFFFSDFILFLHSQALSHPKPLAKEKEEEEKKKARRDKRQTLFSVARKK